MQSNSQPLPLDLDIGRDYCDNPDTLPHIRFTPMPKEPHSAHPTLVTVTTKQGALQRKIGYAHLALLKLCKCEFETLLDIGSAGGDCADIFKHMGKKVTTIEADSQLARKYAADYERDFIKASFPKKFDAIWCSHTLEHVRNPGLFLDKVYDDLHEGGYLALTVPFNDFNTNPWSFCLGHINKFNELLLLYHLVCAGFDCSHAAVKVYSGQISVVLKKVSNGVLRGNCALYSNFPPDPNSKPVDCFDSRIYNFFPVKFEYAGHFQGYYSINWDGVI